MYMLRYFLYQTPDFHHKQDAWISILDIGKPSSYFSKDADFLCVDLDSATVKISRLSAIIFTANMCIYRVFLQYAAQHRDGCYRNKYRGKICMHIYP